MYMYGSYESAWGDGAIETARTDLTFLVIPAAHHKVNHLLTVERILLIHDTQCSEAPVYRVHAQVRSQMVGKVILVLPMT